MISFDDDDMDMNLFLKIYKFSFVIYSTNHANF